MRTSAQKGFAPLFVILLISILSAVAVGGSFIYKGVSEKNKTTVIQNENINTRKEPIITNTPTATPSITSTKTTTPVETLSYDGLCVSFKYPDTFKITSEEITKDHKIIENQNQYGATSLTLKNKVGSQSYKDYNYISINCSPKPNSIYKGPKETTEMIKISSTDAYKTIFSNKNDHSGVVVVTALNKNYYLFMRLSWREINETLEDSEELKVFNSIVSSLVIKDIFTK